MRTKAPVLRLPARPHSRDLADAVTPERVSPTAPRARDLAGLLRLPAHPHSRNLADAVTRLTPERAPCTPTPRARDLAGPRASHPPSRLRLAAGTATTTPDAAVLRIAAAAAAAVVRRPHGLAGRSDLRPYASCCRVPLPSATPPPVFLDGTDFSPPLSRSDFGRHDASLLQVRVGPLLGF
ncbi:uncharacterized protein LOC120702701 isoform X1 [Panicum virgatum]|uniref:uncharacterized protein LOC120702701 isoform X1 n=1 Tax=Panicum virgatum TaxID=38727 RepID=UPI0019D697F3|nr:uncharacterized protein LOC120702701 isoform X1 [Panicum virgatum]